MIRAIFSHIFRQSTDSWQQYRYESQAAKDSHFQTEMFLAATEWFQNRGYVQEHWELKPVEGITNFTRPQLTKHKDPFLAVTEVVYPDEDTAEKSIPYWSAVTDVSRRDEQGTLLYGIWRNPAANEKIYVVHAYESLQYLTDVHVKSKEMDEMRAYGAGKMSLNVWKLKLQEGFLARSSS